MVFCKGLKYIYCSVIIWHTLIPNLSRSKNFILWSFCSLRLNRIWLDQNPTVPSIIDHVKLYYVNMGAITNAMDHRSSKRTMHIKRKYHVIRELVENGYIKMCKIGTESNTTDPLIKLLPFAKHDRHIDAMGIRYMRDWL
jgi:hypothetical protein